VSSYACTTTFVQASETAIFMSASTAASKSSASAIPARACRTTATPSGRAGMVIRTSGNAAPIIIPRRFRSTPGPLGWPRHGR
jgi:hypothetical protein